MIKRKKYLKKIGDELNELDSILFLIGARQVGKTSLLASLIEFGYLSKTETVSISGDRIWDSEFANGDEFLRWLELEYNVEDMKYLIIDEVHFIKNIGIILKTLIDDIRSGKFQFKIIVSGSGSLNVFKGIGDTLTGRKKNIYVYSFDFSEFCEFKGLKFDTMKIEDINPTTFKILMKYFEEYSLYGGYPKVVLTKNVEKKQELFIDLLNDYIFKDVILLLGEKEIINFRKFLKLLASKVGSLISITDMAGEIGVSRYVLEKYMFTLENTFIISTVDGFKGGNISGEITKLQKVYFKDIGFLRYFLGFKEWTGDYKGKMVENFILNEISINKGSKHNIYFWCRKNGTEVDFILQDNFNGQLIPIEVKSGNKDNVPKSYKNFIDYYKKIIDKGVVTVSDFYKTRQIADKEIKFISYLLIGKF